MAADVCAHGCRIDGRGVRERVELHSYGPCSYGLYNYGRYIYCQHSYGQYRYGLQMKAAYVKRAQLLEAELMAVVQEQECLVELATTAQDIPLP